MTYALGLNDAVNEGTSETSEELLRLRVAFGLAVRLAVLLVRLRGLCVLARMPNAIVGDRR